MIGSPCYQKKCYVDELLKGKTQMSEKMSIHDENVARQIITSLMKMQNLLPCERRYNLLQKHWYILEF